MNCRKVSHLLSAYMDGELPGVEHRQIHEHIAQCGECAQEYQGLLQTKRLLANMRVREAQVDMPARIRDQVHAQHATRAARAPWRDQLHRWITTQAPKPQYMALAACVAALGIVYTSYAIDHSDQIVWHPANATEVAALPPAPGEGAIQPLNVDPMQTLPGFPASMPVSNTTWTPVNTFAPPRNPDPRPSAKRPTYAVPNAPLWSGMPDVPGR